MVPRSILGGMFVAASLQVPMLLGSPGATEPGNPEPMVAYGEKDGDATAHAISAIYQKTFWGYELEPPGLHQDVPAIAKYGAAAVPISVAYLLKGKLDQRKTAAFAIRELAETVPDRYIDDIVSAYFVEHDDWTRQGIDGTVQAVLTHPAGRAETLAAKYAPLLKSRDWQERLKAASLFATAYVTKSAYADDLLRCYERENLDAIRSRLIVALAQVFPQERDMAFRLARGSNQVLRACAVAALAQDLYRDTEIAAYLDKIANDRGRDATDRITILTHYGDLNKRREYILARMCDPEESTEFRQDVMSKGIDQYVEDEYANLDQSPSADQYGELVTALSALSAVSTNSPTEQLLQVHAALALHAPRTIQRITQAKYEYHADGRLKGVRTGPLPLPGESLQGYCAVLYFLEVGTCIAGKEMENGQRKLRKALLLAADIQAKSRGGVIEDGLSGSTWRSLLTSRPAEVKRLLDTIDREALTQGARDALRTLAEQIRMHTEGRSQ